jgi:hypothetical protein
MEVLRIYKCLKTSAPYLKDREWKVEVDDYVSFLGELITQELNFQFQR